MLKQFNVLCENFSGIKFYPHLRFIENVKSVLLRENKLYLLILNLKNRKRKRVVDFPKKKTDRYKIVKLRDCNVAHQ